MTESGTLLEFPCAYPLKVMGRNSGEFEAEVQSIVEKHIPETGRIDYSSRVSSGGKYLSVTATLLIQDREQLLALYADLNSSSLVLVTL